MGKVGTRAQVWHGTAEKTPGGLRKKDLVMKEVVLDVVKQVVV